MENSVTAEKPKGSRTALRVLKIIRTIFIYLLAVGIIIAALLFASSNTPNKSLFGYRYYTVLTPSMEPTYSVGDMVFVKIEKADSINVGDVITFNPSSDSEAYLTHRVTEKLTNYDGTGVTCFRTKGDANDTEDDFLLDEGRVIGRVKFGIPWLGSIVRFVQLRWYFVVPLIILVFVFFKLLSVYFSRDDEEAESEEPGEDASDNEDETPEDEASPAEPEQPSEDDSEANEDDDSEILSERKKNNDDQEEKVR
ncbi:MAG: signal peptidase I [Ruminococcus sp.]|nr:signal peptidase I [Ruminococcus sp.]